MQSSSCLNRKVSTSKLHNGRDSNLLARGQSWWGRKPVRDRAKFYHPRDERVRGGVAVCPLILDNNLGRFAEDRCLLKEA